MDAREETVPEQRGRRTCELMETVAARTRSAQVGARQNSRMETRKWGKVPPLAKELFAIDAW